MALGTYKGILVAKGGNLTDGNLSIINTRDLTSQAVINSTEVVATVCGGTEPHIVGSHERTRTTLGRVGFLHLEAYGKLMPS